MFFPTAYAFASLRNICYLSKHSSYLDIENSRQHYFKEIQTTMWQDMVFMSVETVRWIIQKKIGKSVIVVRYREWKKRGGDERYVGRSRGEIDDLG